MSKLILNVSDKPYKKEEIKALLEKEQELRKGLGRNPFNGSSKTWQVKELFPKNITDWLELGVYLLERTIPWNVEGHIVEVPSYWLRITPEQRNNFSNSCDSKTISDIVDKLYNGDVLVIQNDLLRYSKDWMSSFNEFIATGARIDKDYLVVQCFEFFDC